VGVNRLHQLPQALEIGVREAGDAAGVIKAVILERPIKVQAPAINWSQQHHCTLRARGSDYRTNRSTWHLQN
jgi:hypothetical protein